MSPIPNKKEKTEKEKRIEALREQVAKAESKGQFDTAHHTMLKRELGEQPKEKANDGE
jgi:hypothetical protein